MEPKHEQDDLNEDAELRPRLLLKDETDLATPLPVSLSTLDPIESVRSYLTDGSARKHAQILAAFFLALVLQLVDVVHVILSHLLHSDVLVFDWPERADQLHVLGEDVDLDAEVTNCRREMAMAHIDQSTGFVFRVTSVSRALIVRYRRKGSLNDLDTQVDLCEEALTLLDTTHPGHPGRGLLLCAQADPLRLRARPRGRYEDLPRSIALCREALTLCAPGFLERDRPLDDLGVGLRLLYYQTSDISNLNDAIGLHEEALALRPPGHGRRHAALGSSATALEARYSRLSHKEDLELAFQRHREALQLREKGHPERSVSLNCLAVALVSRFETQGDFDSLDEGIRYFEEALEITPVGHQERGYTLSNLAGTMNYRYDLLGNIRDIDRSIDLLVESLDIRPPGHLLRSVSLGNLANALQSRFEHSGQISDLEKAIELRREMSRTRTTDDPTQTHWLANLAETLHRLFDLTQNNKDINEAVCIAEESLELCNDGHPHRARSLEVAGECLKKRFRHSGNLEDLDLAVQRSEESVKLCPPFYYRRYMHLSQLASVYQLRYSHRNPPSDDEDALLSLDHFSEALSTVDEGHVGRSDCLFGLARLHLLQKSSIYDASKALRYLLDAVSDTHHGAQDRWKEGLIILESVGDHSWDKEARLLLMSVYDAMMRLIPRVAYFGLDLHARLVTLRKAESLANDAAGHAVTLHNPVSAVEMLEAGRGMFWTQALHLRTPFNDLPPRLAQRLMSLSRKLEADSFEKPEEDASAAKDAADQRRRQSTEFEALLDEARGLPGFKNFMLPDTYETLRTAAKDGPIVVLIASPVTCQAILITRSSERPKQVPLCVSFDKLSEMARITRAESIKYRDVLHRDCDDGRGMKIKLAENDRSVDLLAELWRKVVFPVVDALGLQKICGRARPRIWWCPTGPFAFLPVHAAGLYQDGGNVDSCSDYFVSSYTPTIRALISARRTLETAPPVHAPLVLLAGVPRPPTKPSLPYAAEELRSIREVIPAELIIALPVDEDPTNNDNAGTTAETLVDKLSEAAILHLASHGTQDDCAPLHSGFVMQDKVLTVARLMQLELPHASFAFLSACETAKGDKEQPNQTVHLAAAMMFAGFRSVVGTMWAMGDRDGPLVAKAVYQEVFRSGHADFGSIPYALDDAAQLLRAEGVHPNRWATYIHLGA